MEIELRDYFAGKALSELVALDIYGGRYTPKEAAEEAYIYADAMMEARKGVE